MTQIEHLQAVILSIAKDIDKICKENNIEYYLLGGSCIGAIRHQGFIPWDDDLDIIMTRANYNRFIEVCKTKLDKEKYYLQVGLKDWPLYFSKIRLKGTNIHEPEDDYASPDMRGIFVDIFALDNVSDNKFLAFFQYILGKYYLCYQLGKRKYKNTSIKKKLMIILASPLRVPFLRRLVKNYMEKFNSRSTERLGFFYGRTRLKNAIVKKSIYGKPTYVPFEDTVLPVPEYYHEYLTQLFGDYMKLPPENQRVGNHMLSIDFGKY